MATTDLVQRCWLTGFIAGAISGAVVGILLFPLGGTYLGLIFGALLGLLVGVAESGALIALVDAGAPPVVVSGVAAAIAAGVVAAPAIGMAELEGWALAGTLLATGALAAVLTPPTVAPSTSERPSARPGETF